MGFFSAGFGKSGGAIIDTSCELNKNPIVFWLDLEVFGGFVVVPLEGENMLANPEVFWFDLKVSGGLINVPLPKGDAVFVNILPYFLVGGSFRNRLGDGLIVILENREEVSAVDWLLELYFFYLGSS